MRGFPRVLSRSGVFVRGSLLPSLDPAVDDGLTSARDAERPRRYVLGDRRACGHIRAFAHAYGSDQLRIAADECAIFDDGVVLVLAVVIAGDGSSADVDLG